MARSEAQEGHEGRNEGAMRPLHRFLVFIAALGGVLFIALGAYLFATAPPAVAPWTREVDAPIGRFEAISAVIDDDLYRFSGFVEELKATRAAYRYRGASGAWERLTDIPVPVTHCNAVVDGRFIWIAGGFVGDDPGKATAAVWRYDSETDEWTAERPLPEPRAGGALVKIGRRLHYFGGFASDRDSVRGDHFVLDLARKAGWQSRAPLPSPRGHLAGAELGGLAYAVGGQLRHDTKPLDLRFVHAYDPLKDEWSERAALPSGRSHDEQSILVGNGKIALLGGRDTSSLRNRFFRRRTPGAPLDKVTVYDPEKNLWTEIARLPEGLIGPSAHLMGDKVWLLGGSTNGAWEPQRATYSVPARLFLGENR
ncbi:MAG: Kelch repeat-containing protein [Myxococcota bacterium]